MFKCIDVFDVALACICVSVCVNVCYVRACFYEILSTLVCVNMY